MASLFEDEKQLFEKFWRGTFKAVAMPRPESVIIASIAASRPVTRLETVSLTPKPSEPEKPAVETTETTERKRHVKHRRHKHRRRHHARSVSSEADISPWPTAKRKKKKKNSKQKRRRERSPSSSPSPVRKKKKKKKHSKKRKQHRSASKKTKHRASNNRRKRKEDRKHKKRSWSDSHHRHRSRRADNRSPRRRSLSPQNRSEDYHKPDHSSSPLRDQRRFDWGAAVKLTNSTPSRCRALTSERSVKRLHPGLEALNRTAIVQHSLSNQGKGHADYDSGNDTSSPPSTKTGITRAKVVGGRNVSCQELGSPEKLRFTSRDNVSDSGNSLTSYDSACEVVQAERNLPRTNLWSVKREESRSYAAFRTLQLDVASRAARSLTQSESRSRSRTRSSRSSRYRDSDSGSRSLSSSHRSYCRSSSYSRDSRSGSVCSVNRGRSDRRSRYEAVRSGGRRPGSSSCRKQSKRDRKWSRRRFSSPMRKRRRGSPSHLEARRITSARKRPIPYYRPSPSSSSSSRCSSLSSWSLFSLNHSRSPRRTRSSYRSYSHASSWNSAYSSRSRSRSRSYDSLAIYRRTRH
ncbi:serine/arginine repetitive matrix protein 4 [Electrophorus electricus]|uniref:serine/arginine repetitive matrix protein 4 n=1 Tax=Electrophorus electricus TaxID=8005 RepID=UPI0015CFDF97|nr:serine/arginine repetitive matrix protein 4 [Electrophorus electricus]